MIDLATIIPAAGLGGLASWGGQAISAYFKTRGDRGSNRENLDATVEMHKDKLTFELLKAAREEVASARIEAAEIRTMQMRLVHFDEALDHIEALMTAGDDPVALTAAKRRGTQFLTRMRRFSEAQGTLKNEAAIEAAAKNLNINLNGQI